MFYTLVPVRAGRLRRDAAPQDPGAPDGCPRGHHDHRRGHRVRRDAVPRTVRGRTRRVRRGRPRRAVAPMSGRSSGAVEPMGGDFAPHPTA